MKRALLLPVLALSLYVSPLVAAAQPGAAVASGCAIEHRSVAAILEVAGTGEEIDPLPDTIPYVAATGTAADPVLTERVRATAEQIAACVSAGDFLGFLSLMSDDMLVRFTADLDEESIAVIEGEPEPLASDQVVTLIEVRDVVVAEDGRVSALVLFDQGDRESPELTSVITFLVGPERLFIDEWQPVEIEVPEESWQIVEGAGYRGAIVPMTEAQIYIKGLTGRETQGAWLPSPEEIAALEAKLPVFLSDAPSAKDDLAERVPGYLRHYIGFVDDAHAYIMVNAFCDELEPGWASEIQIVMDGGDCFFHVVYDPANGTFLDLSINGNA